MIEYIQDLLRNYRELRDFSRGYDEKLKDQQYLQDKGHIRWGVSTISTGQINVKHLIVSDEGSAFLQRWKVLDCFV
ncbi:hypothetical protein HOC80_05540 [archaeon]|jgi:hypothetical protein|nr:hypothetical protein [archaeon]MBT4417536.1 hypothetical protein [archaeon]